MLLSTLVLALLGPAFAAPTPLHSFSPRLALASGPRASASDLSPREVKDIARLASVVNDAYCGTSSGRLLSNSQPENEDEDQSTGLKWQITHDRNANTLFLAFTSPPPEDLLEILASSSPPQGDHLVPSPFAISRSRDDHALIYTPYLPYLVIMEEATEALFEQIALLSRPSRFSRILSNAAAVLGYPTSVHSTSGPRIEIVGHGLGSVTGLLASLALHLQHPDTTVRTTLFSMPKVGNEAFGDLVDDAARQRLEIWRITRGSDPVPSLPPAHYGLMHPSSIRDIHLTAQSDGTALPAGRGRVEDGLGPFAGQMIGGRC